MGIKTEWLRYGKGGLYSGFAAWPEVTPAEPLPAVIVFQEAWGVDAHIQDVTGRVARAGYFAFAPDLFAKDGARPPALTEQRMVALQAFMNTLPPTAWGNPQERDAALAKRPEAERTQLTESMTAMMGTVGGNQDDQLVASSQFLRAENAATKGQKVAATGFCMGGGRAVRLAALDSQLAGAAIFYGGPPPDDFIPKINCPVIGFYGSEDKGLTSGVPAFAEKMKQHGKQFMPTIYEGAKHAFSNDLRPAYHVGATRDSWVKLLTFLEQQLVG